MPTYYKSVIITRVWIVKIHDDDIGNNEDADDNDGDDDDGADDRLMTEWLGLLCLCKLMYDEIMCLCLML